MCVAALRLAGALTVMFTTCVPLSALAGEVEWTITSSNAVAPPANPLTHRVQRRFLAKEGRFAVRTGFTYLSRGDLRTNPGVGLDVTWYLFEWLGIEFSSTAYFSKLSQTATDIRESFGYLPDSQKPVARVAGGGRLSFAYGKLLVEPLDWIIHLDASVAVHGGVMITDTTTNPAVDGGLAFQAGLLKWLWVWTEFGYLLSAETRRRSTLASGPFATIGLGFVTP